MADIREQKRALEHRLDDGWLRIKEAEEQGRDCSQWEQFWLSLLGSYEHLCDVLDRMSP